MGNNPNRPVRFNAERSVVPLSLLDSIVKEGFTRTVNCFLENECQTSDIPRPPRVGHRQK